MKHNANNLPVLKVGDLVVPAGSLRDPRTVKPIVGIIIEVEDDEHIRIFWNDTKDWAWSHAGYLDVISYADGQSRRD